ncbi:MULTISPECIES: S9 family peptidase [unclassified Pseudoclavibacter]|uniref:alpha/beta hydrolase family protein n=1 Tax=unclassified Pseudoclavibacter TaxID=2615177 RepID=UPI0011B0A2CB|nr:MULTISPECIES: prolyl oligopeptidase family serine peptidase [unclassified Pseudoclavibacter]
MTDASVRGMPGDPEARRETYGSDADQHLTFWAASGSVRGLAVLIHGGYWRSQFTDELMLPLVPEFTRRGWSVANLEYRRGDDGWSATRGDLSRGLSAARSEASRLTPDARLVIVGHSVGGQLALLGGEPGDAVVALAPVTDLARGYEEGNGDGAVSEFFRVAPSQAPEVYASASPIEHLPLQARALLVHGVDDERVPVEHTRAYVAAARQAGADVELIEPATLEHRVAIAPDAPHWPDVHAWLDAFAFARHT